MNPKKNEIRAMTAYGLYLAGCDRKEIAKICDVSVSTTGKDIKRGRKGISGFSVENEEREREIFHFFGNMHPESQDTTIARLLLLGLANRLVMDYWEIDGEIDNRVLSLHNRLFSHLTSSKWVPNKELVKIKEDIVTFLKIEKKFRNIKASIGGAVVNRYPNPDYGQKVYPINIFGESEE